MSGFGRPPADSLVLEPRAPVVELPSRTQVGLQVEVVKSSGEAAVFQVDVPTGSSLLHALELLQKNNKDFTSVKLFFFYFKIFCVP